MLQRHQKNDAFFSFYNIYLKINNMKICSKCQEIKQLDKFYVSKSCKDGLTKLCKSCTISNNKIYKKTYNKNKKYNKEYSILWKEKNPTYFKTYYENNKDKINEYQKIKKTKNTIYKLSANIRSRISQIISGYSKSISTLNILGINNFNEFKLYIENQFVDGMTWDNYGWGPNKWVIDHRIPISSAKNKQELYDLNHHTNLQPMWWYANIIKGDKIL